MHVESDSIIIDIIVKHGATENVFKKFDATGSDCVLCQTLFETVGNFARTCNLNPEKLIAELNAIIAEEQSMASL